MGNEASLEGGEGLPEGLAPDGKGGFVRVSDGTPVDLSKLSEEQRQQLSAAMARAQGKQPPGAAARRPSQGDVQQRSQQVGGSRGSGGLSKSRTVDAFNQGPVGKPSPGRSPSSLSLFESRFRQEPKTSESKSSGMFGSSFLSGANPLSAMTSSLSSMGDSVNIPKFGIFGDEEEGDAPAKGPQQQGPKGPQQGGLQKPGQGPAGQGPKPGQGPPGQGPKPGQGPPGQGPKPGQGPPGQGPPGQGPPGQGPKPGQGPPGQGPKPGQGAPGQGPKPGQGPPGQGPKPGQGPQGQGPKPGQGPQGQGPKPGQGPQGQGPKPGQGPQGQGPKPGQGPQGQGPKPGQGPPGPGAKPTGPPQQGAGPKQQGPVGTGSQPSKNAGPATQQGAVKAVPCPLCKTTQMNIGSKDPPNYNNCTECKCQVCSLCGFSPPDSAGKEWLCLNCQMQRAMGGMDPPNPKQGSVPPSPQKQAPGKPGNLLIKQQSHQSDQGLTPPTTPRQKSPGSTSSGPPSPGSPMAGSPKIDPKTGKPIMQKSSPQQSPSKAKQESSFFGGFGLGGLTDSVKSSSATSQSESVTGKLFGGFGGLMETSKPPAQTAPKQEESVAGKLFSGFGGLSDSSSKPPAAASQMFSFGSSLLSSATNLVTGDESTPAEPSGSPPQSPDSGPGSPPDSPFSAPGSPPDSDSAPDTPPARFTKPTKSMSIDAEKKPASTAPAQSCPLCNVELNMGSSDTPNYSLCTECKKTVCNLCGFNPMPHLGEKEWLCLNCQTQRAMAGQLGDEPPPVMGSPKKQPPPAAVAPTSTSTSATPTPAPASVETKPVVEPSALNPDVKVEDPNIPIHDNSSVTSPPDDTPHQTKEYNTGNTPELPALVQTQSSLDREEGGPKPETYTEPCVPVTVVAPHQEDKNTLIQPPSEESETLNLSTKTEIDNTTALLETQPNPEISQSEAPADKQEDASPTADTLLEEPTNSGETQTVTDPEVIPENCETGADVLLKEQGEPNVEDVQSKPVDQSLTETIGDNVVESESVQAEITEKESDIKTDTQHVTVDQPVSEVTDGTLMDTEPARDAITGISNEVEQCVENKEVISTTEQLHTTESTTEETIPEVKPVAENIVEVTPAENSTTEGEVKEIITVKDSAIESPGITNEVEQCIENKEILSTTEQLPIKSPTEEIITEVKPVEENIMGVTTANNSTADDAMIKVKDSAIESPEVVDKSQTYDAKAQEEEVAKSSTEVKADEGEENRQEDLGLSVGEEESTNMSLIPSAEDSNKSVAQASTHFEEHVGTSEKTGSSYLIEQNDTNAQEPLPSEDNIQVSAVASEDVKCEISLEQPSQSIANVPAECQQEDNDDVSALTRANEKPVEEVAEQKVSVTEKEKEFCTNVVESQPVTENLEISISDPDSAGVVKDATPECQIELSIPSHNEQTQSVFQLDSTPLEKADIPESVVCSSLDKSDKVEKTEEPLVEPIKEDAEVKTTEQAPTEKEPETTGSPTGLSDLTKLENTVLPILEAQPKPEEHTSVDTPKTRRKLEVLPIMPDSPSSEEERETLEQNVKEKKKLLVPMDIRGDSLEDSSESIGKESPMSGDDEDFIRKQIIEMSENEDASPTDEENVIRQKIKEQEKNTASASGRARRLTKKATISPDEDEDKHLEEAAAEVVQEGQESKPENSGQAVRQFQTMELNAPGMKIASSEGEVEMECLTDSPDDRSKGEGSSSLHASSFTPGTSPTSISSFDEDSDSSSPSNMSTGEGKQHRKAKHRQPGQLPTIEDSSEEEELREEEELLREQEKQKSSGKKSKRDKEDKSQRRRERSKTPPSNLSPIEDASPTEELRQEAEMEEIRRSSCSDFSPSLESDPEGFEIHASKIAAFQKSYKLPVSSDSPTEDKTQKKPLKTADETYEEILLRAKSPTTEKVDNQPEKEALYGGMLIEDYAYTSLIDNSTNEKEEPERMALPTQPKKLRSPDEVYEDMLKKRKEFQKLEEEYQKMQPKQEPVPTPEIVLQPAENINNPTTITIDTDGKPLLDADTAYEELMRKVLTPTSPSQQDQDVETTPTKRALYPIPDLKVTQCSSGELSSDEEFYKKEEEPETPKPPPVSESSQVSPSEPSDVIVSTSQAAVDLSGLSKATPLMCSVTPLPTVPQYTPGIQSVVTTAPPVPPKPYIMRRGHSQDSADMAVAPPPTTAKPTVFPRKAPVPLPYQASTTPVKPEDLISMTAVHGSPIRQPTGIPTYRAHVPPPVPPKPCIPCGMSEGPRAAHGVKPPIAPKPASQPTSPAHVPHPPRPTMLPTGSAEIALNLSPTSEHKQFQSSPKSPPSPRYASNLRDTYVVITLPSQPSSPVEPILTQAPSSPAPASPLHQAPPHSYTQPQAQQQTYPPQQVPPQAQRVPLAYTRVIESIEKQEICSPEKHVSSSCRIIEAISASAQPPVVTPNLISQVVTTEVQRTTVSVVHERTPPPVPAPRANGVPLDKTKQQNPLQTTQAVQPCEVVDLRTMKVDQQSTMNGVDLSAGPDPRRQSYVTDASRQNSAVQSPVVNLSAESSTVSIVTDSITIVTCAATIQRWDNADATTTSSVPLQLTKNKSFEPLSQIVYRPVDAQPPGLAGAEIPINLSVGSGAGTYQSGPVTTAPPCAFAANGLTTGTATVAGAVDLSTTKPFNTLVSMDGASSEAVTAVITDDDGKPVDLTGGKRAVCCDVVYNLPFAGSCTRQQPTTPLPEDRFGYRDDHYQYDRTPYGMKGFGGIKPSMSDTNLAEAGLFFYKSKNSYNFNGTTDGAVDLTSAKISDAGEAVDYSKKGMYAGMAIPPFSDARVTSAVGTVLGTTNVLRSSNGIVYSSVGSPNPSTYAITTQPGSIFSTTFNNQSGMHTSDTMPSLSNLQNIPLTRSHSFISTLSTTEGEAPLNLELCRTGTTGIDSITPASLTLDTYTDASLEAIAASLEALSSPMVAGDGQYLAERERLEMEKLKQHCLAEELEKERQEIQRFREHEQVLVQKELEELQSMKQQILDQQEDERQAHLLMQKETYAQQQQQLEQIQRLQEQLRLQLEEQKLRQLYPGVQEAVVLGPDGTVLARKITDSGCQTDEEDETISNAYTAGRKKKNAKKSVDSCVQTDDEDQEDWEENRNRRPRTARGDRSAQSEVSLQAHTEISIQTDTEGNIRMESRLKLSDSDSPKKRLTPLQIGQSGSLKSDSLTLQAPKSPKVLYSPLSPGVSPSKSLEFVSYEKSLGGTSPQKLSPRGKAMQRSLSDPKPMSPTAEERATSGPQYGPQSKPSTPTGTQKKVKRTLPNPPSEEESTTATATTTTGQTAYSTNSARRRMCRNSNMARAKILQDIDRELDMVERESSKLRHRQAELDEEEKEIDAKLRYLEMGINRRKDALLKERDKRERAYLQSVADDRDYMSDSEVSHIRETRSVIGAVEDEDIEVHGLERPRTAPQSELDDFGSSQTKGEYDKYSQYPYSQSQYQSLYQTPQSYQSPSIYSSVPSLTSSQQQSYHQMLLLQQKAARQAALLSELDATKYDVISRQPDPTSSAYLGVKYDKYGNHLDLRALDVGSIANTPMSAVSDSYYSDVDHHTPRSYMLLEDAAEIAKASTGLSSSYSLAERELAKAEKLLRRSAADLGSTDYLGSTSRLHTYGKTPDDEDTMEEPYELKLLKQQLKQEFRRSTGGTESLEQLSGQHYYTPTTGLSSYSQRQYPKTDKYSISRLTLEKQAAKQLPAPMLYQKHKTPLIEPKASSKYSSVGDRGLESEYTSYIGSSGSPRTSRLMQDEITFGLRKNIAEQQKYLGSNLGANLAGSLNLGQSLGLDSAYPSGSRSRPPSRPTSCYGLDLSIKRDPSSSSLRLKGDGESGDGSSYQTPSGRTKPTSLPIVQSGRGRIPIVAQNSEEESPLSPVGQPMGMARASAGPLPPISADSRDQFGSCLSLQDPQQQQQYIREEPTRGRGSVLLDDLQGTMSDSEALSEHPMTASSGDATHAYHLRHEETDWFEKPRDGRADGLNKRQGKGPYYPFPHLRVKLQRDPKDRTVSGNGLGIRIVGGKEVPNSNGDIGAYVAKVLPGGAAEQTGKILEGMQVLEWNGIFLTGKTYEEVQGLVGQPCNEAEMCVRLDLNMLAESEMSQNLDFQEHSKSERPPRSPGVDPMQLAAELQKVSQQQAPLLPTSSTSSPAQPGSPSISKKRHSSKSAEGTKTHSHPISGEIQLQIHYDKQLGNLIVHVLQARNLAPRDNNGYSDPFVKVYLLPGRGAENKRKSKHAGRSINPEWNQTVIYKNIHLEQLKKKTLEVSVWDYDKCSSNDFLGEVLIDLSNTSQLDNAPRWVPLKEQSEGDHHRRSHSGQSRHSSKTSSQHSSPKTGSTHDIHDSPKSSVTKSRSHGVFPDPAKDTQVPSIEKSHSSPGTAKPSQSEGHGQGQHSRSHAAHTKSTTRHHQDSGRGSTIAAGDALVQSQQQPPQRLQPSHRGRFSLKPQRHSVVGVLTIQRGQSDWLPTQPPAALRRPPDGRLATLRKAWSEERPQSSGARSAYRSGETPVTAASMDSGLSGSVYSLLDEEAEANEVDSAIFQVPRFGKIPNGTDIVKSSLGHHDGEGKTHAMGEIKIALKKEVRTEGDHLVLEILQCRNITYKFKSPDHLPDLYVKLYVVNIATQKRIIKKKTRVCRHDREPSFNETFRFCMNPTGHALQLFLVSNGGKFVKKTLIGEAYVWLDKVDLRKRVVSWHKLHTSTAQIHS